MLEKLFVRLKELWLEVRKPVREVYLLDWFQRNIKKSLSDVPIFQSFCYLFFLHNLLSQVNGCKQYFRNL